jgi:hypothetical protein
VLGEGMLYIQEADGTIGVYDKRGILENRFATLREARDWVDDQIREDVACLKIAERTKIRTRQLISEWATEAAAEFNLNLVDVQLEIRWALEDMLDDLRDE